MSNIHILDRQGNGYRVAFHIAVPGTTNSAGLAWSAVLLQSGEGGRTVLADGNGSGADGGIATAEKASIAAGTVLEAVDTVAVPNGPTGQAMTTAQLNAWLDALFAVKTADAQARIAVVYAQYGRVR